MDWEVVVLVVAGLQISLLLSHQKAAASTSSFNRLLCTGLARAPHFAPSPQTFRPAVLTISYIPNLSIVCKSMKGIQEKQNTTCYTLQQSREVLSAHKNKRMQISALTSQHACIQINVLQNLCNAQDLAGICRTDILVQCTMFCNRLVQH